MFFRKNTNNTKYNDGLKLLANRLLWISANEKASVILLAGTGLEASVNICKDLYNQLTDLCDKTITLVSLTASQEEEIDWDHDLTIVYCENVFISPGLFQISDKIDASLMLIQAASTSRHTVHKALLFLKEINLNVSGVILHNFVEKVPGFIKRIFF